MKQSPVSTLNAETGFFVFMYRPGEQKCGRVLASRDQKLGVRERDLQLCSTAKFIILSAILWQSLYVCANINFCALLKFT